MKKITKKQRATHTNTIAVLTPNELGFAVGGAVSTALGITVPQFEPNRPLRFGIIVHE